MFSTRIAPSTVAGHLETDDWCIVDCRFDLADPGAGVRTYAAAHLPGAVYAHLDDDLSAPVQPGITGRHPLPDPATLARTLGSWGIGEGVQVVVYDDRGGGIAARLWWLLRWLGHEAVAVLDGGWSAWTVAGLPTTAAVPAPTPRTFMPRPRPSMVAGVEDVETHLDDPDWLLVDARDAARYQGRHEPIDPVAGHIPGAVSHPWKTNLESDGKLLGKETLRDRFAALLGGIPASRTICYCGSGVTAAHNVLAMANAGLGMPRLYPGSWSHWITDPNHPIAREGEPDAPESSATP